VPPTKSNTCFVPISGWRNFINFLKVFHSHLAFIITPVQDSDATSSLLPPALKKDSVASTLYPMLCLKHIDQAIAPMPKFLILFFPNLLTNKVFANEKKRSDCWFVK
jgi:hypothetical protein